MALTNLPEEVLIILIKKLDTISQYNLYNTCTHIRNIISTHIVIKDCQLSLNTMATAQSLKLNFFKDISYHLQELNMCGVPDLCKTMLLPAVKKLKNLKTLDVSYTNITIPDFVEILKLCPTIRNITINFILSRANISIERKVLVEVQNSFQQMENVHFVGAAYNLLYSKLSFFILNSAVINCLKYSISQRDILTYHLDENVSWEPNIKFKQLSVYFLDWEKSYTLSNSLSIFTLLNFAKYEVLIICANSNNLFMHSVFATPILKQFISDNFICNIESFTKLNDLSGNAVIMMWEKETIQFDSGFYSDLMKQLQEYFVQQCDAHTLTPLPENCKWFYTRPTMSDFTEKDSNSSLSTFKRRRIAPQSYVLDYDKLFQHKEKLKLNIDFVQLIKSSVTLSAKCDYLKKITFLNLSGLACFSVEFFNILFRCCDNLITLDAVVRSEFLGGSPLSRSIALSKSLKNVRLVDRKFDFKTLFLYLSQCKTLENIHLQITSSVIPNDLPDPSIIIKNCSNLYSLSIKMSTVDTCVIKKSIMYNKVKNQFGKHYLNIELYPDRFKKFSYYPYIDVFNIYPIKPI
ncbi:uncharacterized protein LOC131845989 [Achroia grisella]|uniref:uncharacterized protein LOC131845989 n=1 Tax=Achroia grisella TaxID=688607 RepID=UPI0027D23CCB|nr:uncharacterized protein LOC131845989 [Achroia grisella]XP_059051157.1 uncharacterized protein LOC131845989 [Achroia grisella]XP_059051158.1 uncharacterized protein LOC131845989 [Achroia grisella]XP_059051160.1 uncharacterized protein LOC131845989 [Achroia grisella]XP_059051161.1 uncharacterized protein LOC131845989 [Achroia grisella]